MYWQLGQHVFLSTICLLPKERHESIISNFEVTLNDIGEPSIFYF